MILPCLDRMLVRHAVLLTPSNSSRPFQLLSRQRLAFLNPLAATLMDFPASVANKRLTAGLSPLDATLTKNTRGWGAHVLSTFNSPLCFLALAKCKFSNSFVLIFMQRQ